MTGEGRGVAGGVCLSTTREIQEGLKLNLGGLEYCEFGHMGKKILEIIL